MVENVMDDKRPIGRPSKYDPKYCQEVIDFMSNGKSLTAFAGNIGVHKDTIYEWDKNIPDFSDALCKAKGKCQEWWENTGMDGLFTDKETKFSAPTFIFFMKSRFKDYKETSEHNLNHNGNITLGYALDKEPED